MTHIDHQHGIKLNSEEGNFTETPVSREEVELMTSELELKYAFAFRIKLDPGPATLHSQTELINRLRTEAHQVLAFGEGGDTVLGFFWTPTQLERFKEIVSEYHGSYGVGASYGDSQITAVGDDLGEIAYIATCEATNAAARVQKKDGLSGRTENVAGNTPIYGYRYSVLHADTETEQLKQQIAQGLLDGTLVYGKKDTLLERFVVNEESEFFAKQAEFQIGISNGLSGLPVELIKPIDATKEKEFIMEDASELSILSIDINGFSNVVHRRTMEWLTQRSSKNEQDTSRAYEMIREYRHKISLFFTTLESTTRSLVLADGLQKGVARSELLMSIKAVDWRGDAGGMIVPSQYEDLLLEALKRTLKIMTELDVKATIRKHQNLSLISGPNQKVKVPKIVDETDEQLVEFLREHAIDDSVGRSIIAHYNNEGNADLLVYERDISTGEMKLQLTIRNAVSRSPRE